jgi:hypothetical protein
VYITRAATGLVIGNKNVALNFFHGLSLGCLWAEASLVTLQYLEVVLLTERLKGRTEDLLLRVRFLFRFLSIGTFLACIICFTFPSFIPGTHIEYAYFVSQIIGVGIYTLIIWYYGLTVRRLLQTMQVSKTFYQGFIRQLDLFLFPWTFIAVPSVTFVLIAINIPIFYQNMYIVWGILMISAESFNGLVLYGMRSRRQTDGDSQGSNGPPRKDVSHKGSEAVYQPGGGSHLDHSEHGSAPNSIIGHPTDLDHSERDRTATSSGIGTRTPSLTASGGGSEPGTPYLLNTQVVLDRFGRLKIASPEEPPFLPSQRTIEEADNEEKLIELAAHKKGMSRVEEIDYDDPELGGSVHRNPLCTTTNQPKIPPSRSSEFLLEHPTTCRD